MRETKTLRRILLLSVCILMYIFPVFSQEKEKKPNLFKKLLSSQKNNSKSASLIAIPALAFAPETGIEVGLVADYNFFTNKTDSLTRSSNIGFSGTATFNKQTNFKLASNVWTSNNTYHFITDLGYRNFPFKFYGIGDETLEKDKIPLGQTLFRANLEAEKRMLKNYYTGVMLKFENYNYKDNGESNSLDPDLYYGANGGKYVALGFSQAYDSRNSNTYTTSGLYAQLKYSYAPNLWESDNFTGSFLAVDLRSFFPLNKKFVLGFNSIYQSTIGKEVPFYVMSKLGNDQMMRGYYSGRYRDKGLLALQSELRYRIHPRFALASFVAGGTVYNTQIDFSRVKYSYGSGLRYFFNIEHQSSLRIDYAIGGKAPGEKRQTGFYLSVGQAF